MKKLKVIPIIPSLNPDEKLTGYINKLIEIGFEKIIIVNDGSSADYDKIFNDLSKQEECIILKHAVNQGKGRALKTAFHYFLNNFNNYDGVVTADADGQHSPSDTLKVAESLVKNNNSLIFGTRDFNEPQVPFKSKNGNKITTFFVKLLYGKRINDTQTGLRGIPTKYIVNCLKISGERFDYEINMLITAIRDKMNIIEEKIETIYIENNKSSHFNPIKDSIKIYKIVLGNFLKFTFSGIFSFIVDIFLFSIATKYLFESLSATQCIMYGTIFARVISSLINYHLNRNVVFENNNKTSLIKYYILCIAQMVLSGLLVSKVYSLLVMGKIFCKVVVDIVLFFVSYQIQRRWVFKSDNK